MLMANANDALQGTLETEVVALLPAVASRQKKEMDLVGFHRERQPTLLAGYVGCPPDKAGIAA